MLLAQQGASALDSKWMDSGEGWHKVGEGPWAYPLSIGPNQAEVFIWSLVIDTTSAVWSDR